MLSMYINPVVSMHRVITYLEGGFVKKLFVHSLHTVGLSVYVGMYIQISVNIQIFCSFLIEPHVKVGSRTRRG